MADTLVKKPKLIVGTQSQVEAEMGDNDIGFATDIKFYTAKEVDDLLSDLGGGASLPILSAMMSDHVINDMSWLRADTFSWQSGDMYKAAYEHLVSDYNSSTLQTETIGDITVAYYKAEDGHKICLPDQEANLVSLYESTGVAWYYLLDTANKQFKLPRTKWGFTGLRDEVGKYVPESLPNIKGTFLNGHYTVQGSGAFYDAGAGGTKEYANVADDRKVGFDASRSSSAYKDGAPVQQRATQMYLYFYVGNFEQSAIEQTAGLNAELFNGKADIDDVANLAMPGDRYVDLTLGASESSYTAPADGYVVFGKRVGGNASQFNCLKAANSSGYVSRIESANSVSGQWATVMMPVKKGLVFSVEYSTTGTVAVFRFVYANGAK